MPSICISQALKHSSLATKATDTHSRAEAHHVHAGILKDMGQLEDAEKVYSVFLYFMVGYTYVNQLMKQ